MLELLSNFSRTRHGRPDRRHGCHEHSTTQSHELSLSDVVLLLAFGSVHEVDGLGQAFWSSYRSLSGLADMPAAGVRTVSVSRREGDSGEPGGRPGDAECSGLEYMHVRIGSMQEERPLAPLVIRHLGLRRRCGVKCGPLLRMVR